MDDACARFARALTTAIDDDPGAPADAAWSVHLLTCATCTSLLRREVAIATALRDLAQDAPHPPLAPSLIASIVAAWRSRPGAGQGAAAG